MPDDVAAYIREKGIELLGLLHEAAPWFAEHPQAEADMAECRSLGLSWTQTLAFLREQHECPFRSINVLIRQSQR